MSSLRQQLTMHWEIPIAKMTDLKDHGVELQSDSFTMDGHEFVLCCATSEKHKDKAEIVLLLKALPQQIGAVKLAVSIDSAQLSYSKTYEDVILTLDANRLFEGSIFDAYDCCIKDVIPFKDIPAASASCKSVVFEGVIEFVVIYDLYGGIFSSMNKAIFRKPTENDNQLVYGYLDEINEFDIDNIHRSPLSIYELIYKYYISILSITNEAGDIAQFVWDFNNKAEIETFMACKHGDVITSSRLRINGCCFYFELTPNGWSTLCPEGECAVWLAVDELPPNIRAVHTSFIIRCEEIDYVGEETLKLSTPQLGTYSMTAMTFMDRSKFLPLKKFQFEMTVQIHEMLAMLETEPAEVSEHSEELEDEETDK